MSRQIVLRNFHDAKINLSIENNFNITRKYAFAFKRKIVENNSSIFDARKHCSI